MARHGLHALDRISAYAPELGTEIEGIAAGSGLPVEAIGALNARTELLAAAAGECSTIACLGSMTASGSALGIQTWDWHDELAEGWIVWTIEHPDGRRVETMTEAGIVGKIGMNDRGVAVLLNILGHRDDGPPVGVPIHVLCRTVLDQADGAVSALELVAAADVSASSAITIVTDEESGTACTVEVSPAGPGFVTPDDRGVLVHTNHFLEHPGRDGDSAVREAPGTILRLDLATRRMAAMPPGTVERRRRPGRDGVAPGRRERDVLPPRPRSGARRPVDDPRHRGRRARPAASSASTAAARVRSRRPRRSPRPPGSSSPARGARPAGARRACRRRRDPTAR